MRELRGLPARRTSTGPLAVGVPHGRVGLAQPGGELRRRTGVVTAHYWHDAPGGQGDSGVVGGDRLVGPVGDVRREDLGERLPGQPKVGDLVTADGQVVHERGATGHDRHVGKLAVARRVVGDVVVGQSVGDLRHTEVRGLVLEVRPAQARTVGVEVDVQAVLLHISGPQLHRVRAPGRARSLDRDQGAVGRKGWMSRRTTDRQHKCDQHGCDTSGATTSPDQQRHGTPFLPSRDFRAVHGCSPSGASSTITCGISGVVADFAACRASNLASSFRDAAAALAS